MHLWRLLLKIKTKHVAQAHILNQCTVRILLSAQLKQRAEQKSECQRVSKADKKKKIPSWWSSQLLLSFAVFFPLHLPRDLSREFACGYYSLKMEEKSWLKWDDSLALTKLKENKWHQRKGVAEVSKSRKVQKLVFSLMGAAKSAAENQSSYFDISDYIIGIYNRYN